MERNGDDFAQVAEPNYGGGVIELGACEQLEHLTRMYCAA